MDFGISYKIIIIFLVICSLRLTNAAELLFSRTFAFCKVVSMQITKRLILLSTL